MAREEAGGPPLPGVQARHDRLFALQSDPNAPVPLGEGRAASRPLLPRTPTPALSPGPPHLSGQQEFPFFCLPQLHHVRQGLNRCTDTKRHTAFVMHGKETLPVSSPVPPCHPPAPNKSPSPPAAEATRGVSRGCKYNAPPAPPWIEEVRACGLGPDQGARPPHQAR